MLPEQLIGLLHRHFLSRAKARPLYGDAIRVCEARFEIFIKKEAGCKAWIET